MKNRISLQWKLTLLTALLITSACLLLSYCISKSAILCMDEIENSVVAVFPKAALSEGSAEKASFYLSISGDIAGQIQDTQTEFWKKSLLITVLIVFAGSFLTYFIVGYGLNPLKQLGRQVDEIRAGNIRQLENTKKGSREIVQLTYAFNGMLQRLSDAFSMQRRFSANAAHELRTPLAVMQTKLEVFRKQPHPSEDEYAETMDMVQSQTERLSHVIDVLLEMTELQSAKKNDTVSLSELIEECLCDLAAPGEEKELTLCQKPGDIKITGSYTLLYRAVYNLIENAIKYNHPGGRVDVEIVKEEPFAGIIVSDTGCGLGDADRKKIFEPFYRVDKSRSREIGGAGLGLALVKEIARLHGGHVFVLDSSPEGTQIKLQLSSEASTKEADN